MTISMRMGTILHFKSMQCMAWFPLYMLSMNSHVQGDDFSALVSFNVEAIFRIDTHHHKSELESTRENLMLADWLQWLTVFAILWSRQGTSRWTRIRRMQRRKGELNSNNVTSEFLFGLKYYFFAYVKGSECKSYLKYYYLLAVWDQPSEESRPKYSVTRLSKA